MNAVRNGNVINITGSVVRFEEYDIVKASVRDALTEGATEIKFVFTDAISLNSAIIGYMIKMKRVDGVAVTIKTGNHKLYELLDNLALTDLLNVSKI